MEWYSTNPQSEEAKKLRKTIGAFEVVPPKGFEAAPTPPDPLEAELVVDQKLKEEVGKKGRASTILTPSLGFNYTPSSKKILLGA